MSELGTLLVLPVFIGSGVALFWNPLAGLRAAWLTLAAEIGLIAYLVAR